MTSFECNKSSDCSVDGIVKLCYEENNFDERVFFCECANYFGWRGEDCNEQSDTIYFRIVAELINTIWCTFLVLVTGKVIYLYLKVKYRSDKKTTSKSNPILPVV